MKSPELVVFGEALIDFKDVGPLAFQGYVGGSPLNVAVAASRLGVSSALATRVSTDLFGEAIVAHLAANEVSTGLLERSDEPTTLAFVSHEAGSVRYSFRNEGAADTRYAPDAGASLPVGTRAIHFGSVSLLFEPASTRIAALVGRYRDHCLVHLDPNVRPGLIRDRDSYAARLAAWVRLAHWFKLSREDLEWLSPGQDEASVARRWLDGGASVVVVTDGGNGARLYRRGRAPLVVPAPPVALVDTVGAGDTFSGATVWALLSRGLDSPRALDAASDELLREVLEVATRAAALNCSRAGCDPPTRAELESWAG